MRGTGATHAQTNGGGNIAWHNFAVGGGMLWDEDELGRGDAWNATPLTGGRVFVVCSVGGGGDKAADLDESKKNCVTVSDCVAVGLSNKHILNIIFLNSDIIYLIVDIRRT